MIMHIVTVRMFQRKGQPEFELSSPALAHSTFLYPALLSPWEM